ncbi:hypothetical protein [Pseudomonas sp. WS 5079]|uniref:hypothetical protein n=1 Tax=Pseudomonas sp. WS 5079 TaxID=2717492 RepID=UPI0021CC7577|nr:hypothetical protein [Pseudomonas sp. WS 5079]
MTDNTELKRLAEAATQGDWQVIETELPCRIGRPHVERRIFTAKDHPQLKAPYPVVNGSVALGTDETPVHHMVSMTAEDAAYIAAANPAAVLALIAENERLKSENDEPEWHLMMTKLEDQNVLLKAENERDELALRAFSRVAENAVAERDQLRAEVAGLRTGYEAYERVNAELKAENERIERNRDMWKGQVERQAEELTALREEATEWKDTVKFNEGCWSEERGTMIDKLQESRMRIKELDLLFGRYILAMRAAVIEEEHGLGAEGAMMWIYNSLVGPGELPPENETLAQAYFDREIVAVDNGMQEVLAFHEDRRAALGQGEQS